MTVESGQWRSFVHTFPYWWQKANTRSEKWRSTLVREIYWLNSNYIIACSSALTRPRSQMFCHTEWKEVPAAQVSCGPAFTHTELKPTWLSTSSNHGGGASGKYGGASAKYGGEASAKYWGAISQVWGGHQPTMGGHQSSMGGSSTNYGGAISQVWGGHQPSMGGSSTKYG